MTLVLRHERGRLFQRLLYVTKTEGGDPFDFTGWAVAAEILRFNRSRTGTEVRYDLNASVYEDPTDGALLLSVLPAETELWLPGTYHGDVRAQKGSTDVRFPGRFTLIVDETITRSLA
jgi:hypothetical protein